MAYRYLDTELRSYLKLTDTLQSIYGIGRQRSLYIMNCLGLPDKFFTVHLTGFLFDLISLFFKSYILGPRLKYMIKLRLEMFKQFKLVKGIRFFLRLPIHGQRTHSNARSQKNSVF